LHPGKKGKGARVARWGLFMLAVFCLVTHRKYEGLGDAYAVVSALIFAVVAVAHVVRLIKGWKVEIGPYNVSMNVSWVAVVVAAVIAIWGFMQLG
jgi:hypothetical protein